MNMQPESERRLLSAAGLIHRPVRDAAGDVVGRIDDLVVHWDGERLPILIGLIVTIGRRPFFGHSVFVHAQEVVAFAPTGITLACTTFDLRDYARRPAEWLARSDLLDHQVLDVDGVRVIRICDLYLAQTDRVAEIVAVDTSLRAFWRRAIPGARGVFVDSQHALAHRVVPWTSVQPMHAPGEPIRLRQSHARVHQMRPADVATMLEDASHVAGSSFITALEPDHAAHVLEEMDPHRVREVMRALPSTHAADLLERMAPDEAADALRDLHPGERRRLLSHLPAHRARELGVLAEAAVDRAAGLMTTRLAVVNDTDTISHAREIAIAHAREPDVQALVVVDAEGRLVDDLPMGALIAADPDTQVSDELVPPRPGTVRPSATLAEVIDQLTANRGTSLIVVDDHDHPLGRIIADDVVDAIAWRRPRRWAWQPRRRTRR